MATKGDKSAGGGNWPSTHWSLLADVRDGAGTGHRAALDLLIRRYWKPVYFYLRRRGQNEEDAKDLTQEFFTFWLMKDAFRRADRDRGRFRSFLLSSLDHFVSNRRRKAKAGIRNPEGGVVSIEALCANEDMTFEPEDQQTPEDVFHAEWRRGLLFRGMTLFEQECKISGKQTHFDLFRTLIVDPILTGIEPTSRADLAARLGMRSKDVDNRLITARRAFQKLLRDQIREYASSDEEVAEEVRDLFRLVGD
jgi:RNA polymerase sigma-70 factor (ECF subfamily)